ncbi:hypothetical protein GUJ93_ZPchr0010g8557 [Zizania palustris]|uniref:Uncharacterized protein n=1 Tax=Zizania palustris TaxID=103762 RepID=A0A8J5WBZ5_ZIZPA|nr:hypothetical protein GUJ93_ZPchr0010g8557 [Zizania palustris]
MWIFLYCPNYPQSTLFIFLATHSSNLLHSTTSTGAIATASSPAASVAFTVTDRGDGQIVMNRRFLEYQLSDYNGWLKDRVADPQYWATISACLCDGRACSRMRRFARNPNTGMLMPETPDMFYARDLSPIQGLMSRELGLD